jgi:hypothetical protein
MPPNLDLFTASTEEPINPGDATALRISANLEKRTLKVVVQGELCMDENVFITQGSSLYKGSLGF